MHEWMVLRKCLAERKDVGSQQGLGGTEGEVSWRGKASKRFWRETEACRAGRRAEPNRRAAGGGAGLLPTHPSFGSAEHWQRAHRPLSVDVCVLCRCTCLYFVCVHISVHLYVCVCVCACDCVVYPCAHLACLSGVCSWIAWCLYLCVYDCVCALCVPMWVFVFLSVFVFLCMCSMSGFMVLCLCECVRSSVLWLRHAICSFVYMLYKCLWVVYMVLLCCVWSVLLRLCFYLFVCISVCICVHMYCNHRMCGYHNVVCVWVVRLCPVICIFVYELCRCLSVVSACMWRKCGSVVCLYLWLDYVVFVYVSEYLRVCGINVCVL